MANKFVSYLQGDKQGFQRYGAGAKRYGGGRDAPNIGPVDKSGYRERDAEAKAKRNAMLKRMKATSQGRLMSSDAMNPKGRSY